MYCKNGHFDDPEALFCAICGISMNQQTLVPRPGERPPLGVLLLDDGSVFQLDSDYVVGREPSLDSSVAAGKARPLRVADDTGIVSRVHARVQLDGWRVLVTDLGSANGTRVLLPGHPADQQLVPQVPDRAGHRQPGRPGRARVPLRVPPGPVSATAPDLGENRGRIWR